MHLSWRFISNDVWATLVPGTCFVLAAAQHQHLSMAETAGACALGAGYFWLFIYRFTLGDQLVGVAEDRIVKPFRPLVAGQSSRRGAQRRLVAVNIAFPIYALLLGVLPFALAWQLLCLLNNRWHRSWLTKNLLPGLGVITQLGAAWQIAAPLTPTVWRWILTLAGAVLLMIGIQDLRDVAGDRAQGRRTMPIVFGDRAVRVYFCAIFLVLGPVLWVLLIAPARQQAWAAPIGGLLLAWSVLIAVRVMLRRGPGHDHGTYRLTEQWYAFIVAGAVLLL